MGEGNLINLPFEDYDIISKFQARIRMLNDAMEKVFRPCPEIDQAKVNLEQTYFWIQNAIMRCKHFADNEDGDQESKLRMLRAQKKLSRYHIEKGTKRRPRKVKP